MRRAPFTTRAVTKVLVELLLLSNALSDETDMDASVVDFGKSVYVRARLADLEVYRAECHCHNNCNHTPVNVFKNACYVSEISSAN